MRENVEKFDAYLNHLVQALGHADRHACLKGYCSGLVLPLSPKSIEPMAAHIDPLHASAKHQSLHHFVARAEWSDRAVLQWVLEWAIPALCNFNVNSTPVRRFEANLRPHCRVFRHSGRTCVSERMRSGL
ncbi:transposase [Paraburkholderia humisilvae]|uniref:transposase n=1 Tax=Paraburkholderia humisilvae TaxID=627669 RepID=UPI0024842A58|nr:transposase [Paraburkholderia humisilvae]